MRTAIVVGIVTFIIISTPDAEGQKPLPVCSLDGNECDQSICEAVDRACPPPGPQEICAVVSSLCPAPAAAPALGIRDSSRGLIIKNDDGTPGSVIYVTAAEVILQDASGSAVRVGPVALSVDADASGANGLDSGIREAGTWYHIWIIFDPSSRTAAGLLSLDQEDPVLPTGFDYEARVGAIRTDPTGEFIRIHQVGQRVIREVGRATLQPAQVFLMPVSLATLVPPTAQEVSGSWDTYQYAPAGYGYVAATPQGLGSRSFGYVFSLDGREGNLNTLGSYSLPLAVPQTLYVTVYSGVVNLLVSGWEF